jgi:hypothetical protein
MLNVYAFKSQGTAEGFDEFSLTEDSIIEDPITALPLASWSSEGTVVNKVDIRYDWNQTDFRNDFSRRQIYSAAKSVKRYAAQPSLSADFRGVHTALGGQAVLDRFALLYMQRWGYPPPILQCSLPYRRHMFEPGDVVTVTHSKIPNRVTGTMGLVNERFEVINIAPRWGIQGRLDLTLLWIGVIEQSAVPVSSGALSLIPGESTVDPSDLDIPFGSSVTLTTPTSCSAIRVGLKSLNYRVWRLLYDIYGNELVSGGKEPVFECRLQGQAYDEISFNTKLAYHLQYKRSTAPDAPGTDDDPITGWVTFPSETERGTVSQFSIAGCSSVASLPAEDMWTEFLDNIPPSTYNVRPFFDGVTEQGDPYPAPHVDCGTLGCADTYLSSSLSAELHRMTVDFIEAIV